MLTPSVYTDAWESFILMWFLPACSHFARCNSFVVCSMDQAEYSFQFIQNYFNKYILYMYSITKNEWISHIKSWNQLSCKKILNLEITLTSGEEERQVERLKRRIYSVSWRLSWLQGETEPVPANSDSAEMKRLCTLGRRGRRTRRENQEKGLFCEWVESESHKYGNTRGNIAFIRKWSDIASFFQVPLHLLF